MTPYVTKKPKQQPRKDRRVTPQTREGISFPAHLAWVKEFIADVAREEGLTKSDAYWVAAAVHWSKEHPGLWKKHAKNTPRDAFLRRLGA